MKLREILSAVIFAFVLASVPCRGQGTITITFDGPPPQLPGVAPIIQSYDESGMSFRPIAGSIGFVRQGGGVPLYPENGATYLQAALGSTLIFSFADGTVFNMESVDLAEYSTVVPVARTVQIVAYRHDGTVVSTNITTDGIIDGTGPLVDFEKFTFDPRFIGLDRVEIPTYSWSLDNLVVSVPEPTGISLLLVGGLIFWITRKTCRNRA